MSKFCNNCGSAMEDDVVFCPNCGAQDVPAYDEAPAAKKPLNPMVLILGAIAAVVVLIIVLLLIGSGPKRALNRYEKVVNGKGNIEKLIPEDIFKEAREEDEDFSKKDFLDAMEDSYENSMDAIKDEYGDNAKVNYTLVEAKKMNKDDFEDYAESLDKSWGISEKSIKQAYRMSIRVDIKGKDGKTFYYTSAVAVKVDGKWYTTQILSDLK